MATARGKVTPWALCVVALLLRGCSTDYLGAPTLCDDWCLASQRGQCEDDYPEKCVSTCERGDGPRSYPECETEWHERLACYQRAPDSDFVCERGHTRRKDEVCEVEEARFWACTGSNACAYACLAQASACPDFDPDECKRCAGWLFECEDETQRYVGCLFAREAWSCDGIWFEDVPPECQAEGDAVHACLTGKSAL